MIQFGSLLVPVYGLAVALALMCGMALAMRCARRLQLDTQAVWNLLLIGILAALLGTRVEYFLLHVRDVLHAPAQLLNGSGVSFGGVLAALVACAVYCWFLKKRGTQLPVRRTLDSLAAPLLLALVLLEGMSGILLWDLMHTPAIFAAIHFVACAAIVVWLECKKSFPLRDGELMGAVLYLLALSVVGWQLLQQHELSFSSDLTPQLTLAVVLVLIGAALWIDWKAVPLHRKKVDHAL